jgi:DNA-binding LacI/PurR family transcriptional regulator
MRQEILLNHRSGDRVETEPALAHRFGVSIPTIRSAMLVLEREGLIERRQGSGTYVCDRHARQHIGIVLPVDGLALPTLYAFHLSLARRLWALFEEAGQRVKLYLVNTDAPPTRPQLAHEELLEAAGQGRLAALVVTTTIPDELTGRVSASGAILAGNDERAAVHVSFDYNGMVRDGLRHLIQAGRRHIAMIGWGAPDSHHVIGDVFADAMAGCGLTARREWIRDDLRASMPGAGWEAFREIWRAGAEKPDGILIADDILYRDASIAIRELGIRVPEELMIVTHSNKGATFPQLFPATLLQFNPEAYAETLAQATLALLRGELPAAKDIILTHQVVLATSGRVHDSRELLKWRDV